MPRASSSSKRQQGGAGTRDSRHDNGLVGPAKRLSGRKSQGQFDGPALPADDAVAGSGAASTTPNTNGHTNGSSKSPDATVNNDSRSNSDPYRRSSLGNSSEMSSVSSNSNLAANGLADTHRSIDVNATKNENVHRDSGPFELAATVLKTLPVQDTLAILIILMQVPSLSLTFIYTMFTFLTFVPPVATSSGMSINLAEIFDGHSTMPSLVTVLCVDVFFLLIWLFLWGPIQEAILDLAKPVIAITLGGGTSTRDGTSRGITTCFMWVLVTHLLRGTRVHWGRFVKHIPEHWRLPAIFTESFDVPNAMYDKRSAYGWVRSVLAIHILTQGVVRYIREWYIRREKGSSSSGISDPEAAKPPSIASDASNEAGFATPDTDPSFTPVIHPSTSKKRRKQSTQVRLQQPLWAALASTKIVVVKEYELSHAASESAGSNATDIHNLGNAPFDSQPSQIWISYIGSDEVCFSTSPFPYTDNTTQAPAVNGHAPRPSGIDTSKPFYVRVNNAIWQPTRIFSVEEASDENEEGMRWTGDIYGLRPASKYVCEFVDTQTDEILFTTSIRTIQEPLREADGAPPALANGQRSLRPDSPATTLKTSIAAAEAKLADEKNRLKMMRKEWKTRINALKKDNELTDNQLASAGNHDEKYKQKIRQQETQKTQAERDIEIVGEQLKNFDTAPELSDLKKKLERSYSAEKKQYDAAQKDFKEFKTKLEKEVKAKEVESSNLASRRTKIAARIAKVENELANITDRNNRDLEAERRNQERSAWQTQVSGIERYYQDRINQARVANDDRIEHIRNVQAEIDGFHEYINANGLAYDMSIPEQGHGQLGPPFQPQPTSTWNPNPAAAPHYPSGMWLDSTPEVHPTHSAPALVSNSMWNPPIMATYEQRPIKSRGRSSSMLSEVSGFTQSSGEDRPSPMGSDRIKALWKSDQQANGRGRSRGSGSGSGTGSGSGSGSFVDPMSPN
ncbi:Fc.00g075190.m01.CDS01 [Cosmosporella sp. VM-42]